MRIMSVATAWGSQCGGLNAFNFRLCKALRECNAEISCFVKRYSAADYEDALNRNIKLFHIDRDSTKWSRSDLGYVDKKQI